MLRPDMNLKYQAKRVSVAALWPTLVYFDALYAVYNYKSLSGL